MKNNNTKITIAILGERVANLNKYMEKRFDRMDEHFKEIYDKIDNIEEISNLNKTNLKNHLKHHAVQHEDVQFAMTMRATAISLAIALVGIAVSIILATRFT